MSSSPGIEFSMLNFRLTHYGMRATSYGFGMTYNGLLKTTISLIINIVKQNIRSPHNIGIQNPDLSILIKPIEIDIIERKVR